MSEESIANGMDMEVILTPSDAKVFDLVDEVMDMAVAQGSVDPVVSMVRSLRRSMQASGLALAKILFCLSESWDIIGGEDDMYEVVYAECGIARSTAYKYINMWGAVFNNPAIPEEVKTALRGKSMRSLLLLTAAAREGEIDDSTWENISKATTSSEIRGLVRDVRGERTSSHTAIVLELNMKSGVLTARKSGVVEVVGVLNVSLRDTADLIDASIQRIVDACNIMER
jgi:hypothetical protein